MYDHFELIASAVTQLLFVSSIALAHSAANVQYTVAGYAQTPSRPDFPNFALGCRPVRSC